MKDGLLGPRLGLRHKHDWTMGYSRDLASLFIGQISATRHTLATEFHP